MQYVLMTSDVFQKSSSWRYNVANGMKRFAWRLR